MGHESRHRFSYQAVPYFLRSRRNAATTDYCKFPLRFSCNALITCWTSATLSRQCTTGQPFTPPPGAAAAKEYVSLRMTVL
jgi:hypothetical protein